MVFAVCHMKLETLQLKTCTSREACTVGGTSFVVVDLHLICPAEVIARSDIDVTS